MNVSHALAPILFLVYNRPEHTLQTLNALSSSKLAKDSVIHIVCDGPKANATATDLLNIQKVRELVKSKNWCKSNIVIERPVNQGMALSTVNAITDIINEYGKIIVLEDDVLISPHFLEYLNDGLRLFEKDLEISSINGYAEKFVIQGSFPDYYMLTGSDCWGWASWKNRWDDFIFDPALVKQKLIAADKLDKFEYGGMVTLLNQQIEKTVSTWDTQWCASNVLKDRKGIYPKIPFVTNIGFDGSGANGDKKSKVEKPNIEKLNRYEIKLEDYLQNKGLVFSQYIEDKFRAKFKDRLKPSFLEGSIREAKSLTKKILKRFR